MTNLGTASVKQLALPLVPPEDEVGVGERREDAPVCLPNLLERALERFNMHRALRQVRRNGGAPGVDGMTVEELPEYLKKHWPAIRVQLLEGRPRAATLARLQLHRLRLRRVSPRALALKVFRWKVRRLTRRTRGRSLQQIIWDLQKFLRGWLAYFGFTECPSPLRGLQGWIRRRLRCYCWKQWGRSGYRELKRRGVTSDLAWNTSKSAHGPWRLSQSPALVYALPARGFQRMGLPRLVNG